MCWQYTDNRLRADWSSQGSLDMSLIMMLVNVCLYIYILYDCLTTMFHSRILTVLRSLHKQGAQCLQCLWLTGTFIYIYIYISIRTTQCMLMVYNWDTYVLAPCIVNLLQHPRAKFDMQEQESTNIRLYTRASLKEIFVCRREQCMRRFAFVFLSWTMYQYHPADPRYGALYHEHRQYLQQLQQEYIQSQYNQTRRPASSSPTSPVAWSYIPPVANRIPGDLIMTTSINPGNSSARPAPSSVCNLKDDQVLDGARVASNLEKHVLSALQRLFVGKLFQKVRPSWLRNPRTNRLCELDFYNDELKIGVEVQGLQHYVYPNSWHKTRAEFQEQVFRDQIKVDLCQQAGVILLHIPFTVTSNKVEQFIRDEVTRVALATSPLHQHMSRPLGHWYHVRQLDWLWVRVT